MLTFRLPHLLALLAAGAIVLAAFSFPAQPLFTNLDQFVLVAEEGIHLAENVQVSSGDLAANKEIAIAENNIVSGNLFSDQIKIAEDTQINGNASFNKLQLAPSSSILGSTSTPISLPIIKLPEIPDFYTGEQNLTITRDQSISPGNFNKIEVKPNVALTVSPGTYNLNHLELRENAKLLFSGSIILNIRDEFRVNQNVLIAPPTNIPPTDLSINFAGQKPITVGEDSIISFKLLAPKSKANLGERTTLRGQILAKEINVGAGSVFSREVVFAKESDPAKIVEENKESFVLNEIIVILRDDATLIDAQAIANIVKGRITGFVDRPLTYKIEVEATTSSELDSFITSIESRNNPLVLFVSRNSIAAPR